MVFPIGALLAFLTAAIRCSTPPNRRSHIDRIVDDYFFPQMCALLNELLVDRMFLIDVLSLDVVEKDEFGSAVA